LKELTLTCLDCGKSFKPGEKPDYAMRILILISIILVFFKYADALWEFFLGSLKNVWASWLDSLNETVNSFLGTTGNSLPYIALLVVMIIFLVLCFRVKKYLERKLLEREVTEEEYSPIQLALASIFLILITAGALYYKYSQYWSKNL